jgi:hypothetical protein
VIRSENSHIRTLYKILHDLDCELQMLGVRSDWGIQHTPQFASETLICCLNFLAKQPDAGDLLLSAAQGLIDTAIERELGDDGQRCFSMKALKDAANVNDVTFARLLEEYRSKFQIPVGEVLGSSR